MDLNSAFSSIGNATQNIMSGVNQGVNSVTNAIGNVVGSWSKGLNDEWQNAKQNVSQIPQDVSNSIPQNIQQPIQQGFSNLTGNIQNVIQHPQVAQTLPDDVRQSLIDMTNKVVPMLPIGQQLPAQFIGQGVANLTGTFAKGLTTPFTNKPAIEKAGDIAGAIGAATMPEQAVGMGVFNTVFNPTVGNILQGKMPAMPTPEQTGQDYQQGIQFGAQYGPIAKLLSPLMNPVSAKLAPAGVTGIKGLGQRMLAGSVGSVPAMTAVGAMQPAGSIQQRLQNMGTMAVQGAGFGLVGGAMSKPSLPALSEQYSVNKSQVNPEQTFTSDNGIKYTGSALDTYEKLVPTIAQQQHEFTIDPDGAMAKMLPQGTYDQWYKAQPMNHSEGGNAVLKDARGTFTYINPQDVPQHAEDTTNVMDHQVFDQLTANNGYPELAVLHQTYNADGTPNPLDITDGHHRFPIGNDIGMKSIPAVILDDTKPLLRDQFNQIKGIKDMTIGQMQGGQPQPSGLIGEPNLAYLKQPGQEMNPPEKTLTQLDFENAKKEYMGGNTKAEPVLQSNAERLHGQNAIANFEDAYHARNYDLARQIAENSNIPSIQNLAKRLPVQTPQSPQVNPTIGGDNNVRFLKTPKGQVPSDIGDQENMLGNGLIGRQNVPTTPMPFDQTRVTQQNPYLESQFTSNNQGQMDLNQASTVLNSPQHQALIDSIDQIHQDANIPILNTQSLIGDTKTYGSENSVRQDFMADDNTGRMLAAQKGLAGNQLSVLRFQRDVNGQDALAEFNMPKNLTPQQIGDILNKSGLEYRSINPATNGVTIVDKGSGNLGAINTLLQQYGIKGQVRQGTAEFVGDTSENPTRQNAAQIYNQILQSGGRNIQGVGNGNADNRIQQLGEVAPQEVPEVGNYLKTPPAMAEQGNVLRGVQDLNNMRGNPMPQTSFGQPLTNQDLAMQQLRPTEVTPQSEQLARDAVNKGLDIRNPNNTFTNQQLGMQQLDQMRMQENPDFYGTQANAPTDGTSRPSSELSQALSMKQETQTNLTNAKLIQDNYAQYRIQAQQVGDRPATKTQIDKYVKTLQKNADTLDSRVKALQPDNPLIQNQIQASQDAPQAMKIAQDAATQNGARVTARIKSVESQADQMDRKGKTPTQINDNLGFRVIAPTQAQADATLEQIKASPGVRVVKQEVATDPNTGYTANHLDIKIGDSPQTIEYQGMTQDMAKLSQDTHDQYKVLSNPPTRVQLRQLTQMGYQPDQLSKIGQEDAKGIISNKIPPTDHPTANEPPSATIPPAPGSATLDDAVSSRFSTMQNIKQRSDVLMPMISDAVRNSSETEAFRQAVEHPDQINALSQQTHDPSKFINAVNNFNQFNDYVYKTAEQSGLGMGYVKDYYSHILDLSDPEMQAKFNDLMQQRATNYKGYFTKSRIFANIDDLRQQGFQLKNPSVPLDLQEYSKAAQLAIGNSAFLQKLATYKPDDVKPIGRAGIPVSADGRSFIQSQIPGLSDTAFSQDLNNELHSKVGNSLEPGSIEGLSKYYDKANNFMKQFELSGGGFHILNTAPNYVADQLMSGHFPGVAKAAQVFLSPDAMNSYRQNAVADGTVDKAGAMNVTLSRAQDITADAEGNISGGTAVNPLIHPLKAINQGIFGRLMDYFKLETVRNANVDLSTPKGVADARDIGAQINNMFGGQNRAVGDSIFKSKGAQMLSRAIFLAPDYQEGRIGNTVSAVKGVIPGLSSVGNRYAAKQLLGRIAVTATIAETARRLVTGKFDSNVKDMFQHAFLDPQTPLPFNSIATANAPLGNPQIGRFPTSEPSDMWRAANDPTHFLLSHLGALPSTIISGITGKDYYGNNLTDPYAPQQGMLGNALGTAKALVGSKLPIPWVQGLKVLQGKENIPTALTNTLGIRVAQNPNNPGVIYETDKAALIKSLTPNQQAVFNTLNPQKTDPYTGQPISDPTMQQKLLSTPEKAQILLMNPDIMKAQGDLEKQVAAKSGQQYDPIYDLSPVQQHTVNLMRTFLPGQSTTEKTALINANPWYKDFTTKESQFYGSLPLTQQVSLLPITAAPANVQPLLNQYNALPSGTGARTGFLNAHPEVGAYFQQYNAAKAQEQLALGLIPTTSSTSGGTSRSSSSSSLSPSYNQSYMDRALLRQMLLMKIPQTAFIPVGKLFTEPGQSPTSQGILKISPTQMAKKVSANIRYGGNAMPTFSRTTVNYKKPTFVQNIRQMGGV